MASSAELVSAGQHPADSGTETFMREVDVTLLADLRAELDQVLRVRRRLAEGAPLLCEVCHRPIPAERLEAIPAARFCVLHEERFELGGLHLSDLVASPSPAAAPADAGWPDGGEQDEMLATEDEPSNEGSYDELGPEEAAITTADGEALRVEELEAELSAGGLLEDEAEGALLDLEVSTEDIEASLEELTLVSAERDLAEQQGEQLEDADPGGGASGNVEADLGSVVDRQLGLLGEVTESGAEAGDAEMLPDGDELGSARPRDAGEFVCTGCFLVKNKSQLADEAHTRCVDCVTVSGA